VDAAEDGAGVGGGRGEAGAEGGVAACSEGFREGGGEG